MRESRKKLLTKQSALESIIDVRKRNSKVIPWLVLTLAVIFCLIFTVLHWALGLFALLLSVCLVPAAFWYSHDYRNELNSYTSESVVLDEDVCVDKYVVRDSESLHDHYLCFEKAGKVHVLNYGLGALSSTGLSYDSTSIGDKVYIARIPDLKNSIRFYSAKSYRLRDLTPEELAAETEEYGPIEAELVQELLALEDTPRLSSEEKLTDQDPSFSIDPSAVPLTVAEQVALARFNGSLIDAVAFIARCAPTELLNEVVLTFNTREADLFLKYLTDVKNQRLRK